MIENRWQGQRVLIIGAARQGLALARFLASRGALITLNDQRPAEQMETARLALADLPDIRWVLGGHPTALLDHTDLVCVSGGVPLTLPIIKEAIRRRIPLSNDSQIFLEHVPCPVIGITGSAGKTTTTTLVGRIAERALQPPQRAWVGGNIGTPLITYLDEMQPHDIAIMELSSFQLELMTRSPNIGAILNITPNHLDRHGTFEAYQAAKANILQHQHKTDTAILNREDGGAWALRDQVRGRLITFGFNHPPLGETGTYLEDEKLCWWDGTAAHLLLSRHEIRLRGEHNVANVLAALAIVMAMGWPLEVARAVIREFTGVPHRLELVRVWRGVSWYNDSIATAPERTAAAIRAFSEPLVLLLGGRDKNLPWEDLARLIHERVDHVIVFGESAPKILQVLGPQQSGQRPYTLEHCPTLEEAVLAAARVAEPGDVVLLSPGCTSFDAFRDFEARGEAFRQWVMQLP
ncbi:UDP-N-acetylmuramoyl-L-alanine--D-glutamate ligase [uncultured Thermanaerothrix sp.]|uniref:UDP-N-acetylmuramoyl-L-alanine--D-glutamate ligase n=1 Tax=uncultured Thermanaerothrix sp. TaxID=1195149 RepID=UPI0026373483|nr:UDP-N-acetylmuramoyl-L-alanine--D-glutamate ligase [uncultured Thermanaerothrix sp.]